MPSALGHGRLGVFAKNEIERRVIFGPYEGKLIPLLGSNFAMDKMYTWDVSLSLGIVHLHCDISYIGTGTALECLMCNYYISRCFDC